MAEDIQSSFKELVNNANKEHDKRYFDKDGKEIKKSEWKHLAFLTIGLLIGTMIGYQLNLEKTAQSMAVGICETAQENVNIMVQNFNVLAKTCQEAKNFRDVEILPALGINQTIRVYQ